MSKSLVDCFYLLQKASGCSFIFLQINFHLALDVELLLYIVSIRDIQWRMES